MRNFTPSNLLTKLQTKLSALALLTFTCILISLSGCNKDLNSYPQPDPTPVTQMVNQTFGIKTSTQVSPMKSKSWDKDTWTYNFSTVPATLTLTGVGNPNVYTQSVTIAQLKAGTVTLTMLPGTYDVTFETIHTQAGDGWSVNNTNLWETNAIGNVLDIKIQNSITVTGTPILLTATLEDALIVVDIPSVNKVERYITSNIVNDVPLLLNTVPTIHYGYVDKATWLRIFMEGVAPKVVDMSMIQKAQAYHIITPFGASVNLIVPDMTVNTIII